MSKDTTNSDDWNDNVLQPELQAHVIDISGKLNSGDIGSIITSAKARKIVWSAYVFAGLILGGLSTWFTTTEGNVPTWLQGALAVSAFLAAPFGTLAIANIATKK